MKAIIKVFVFVFLAAFLGFSLSLGLSYIKTTEDDVRSPSISIDNVKVEPQSYAWSLPIYKGILTKSFVGASGKADHVGEFLDAPPEISLPKYGKSSLALSLNGKSINYEDIKEEGLYKGLVLCEVDEKQYGFSFDFSLKVTAPPEPRAWLAQSKVSQGDVLKVRAEGLAKAPRAESKAGLLVFVPEEDGSFSALLGISHLREPGMYSVKVWAQEIEQELSFEVLKADFETQNMEIDLSIPEITQANSPKAYEEYRSKIPPLFEMYDEEKHWSGKFIMPVEAEISTTFGLIRTTNGQNPRRHPAVDIAADENAVVAAPARGRVLLAEYLLNTGYTMVIEHGGGLKSFYYHMNEVSVAEGSMVEQAEQIGLVGSTGYSTGPHLHFEVRIGKEAINPVILCSDESGVN